MKQNLYAEVAKPAGVGLNALGGAVEAFCAGIADFVPAEVEQAGDQGDDSVEPLRWARLVGPARTKQCFAKRQAFDGGLSLNSHHVTRRHHHSDLL